MDKAEEAKKEISQLRTKRQNAIDDARITYLEGFIAGSEYAQRVNRDEKKHNSFWFDQFNERYPDEVKEIMDSDIYSNYQNQQ